MFTSSLTFDRAHRTPPLLETFFRILDLIAFHNPLLWPFSCLSGGWFRIVHVLD